MSGTTIQLLSLDPPNDVYYITYDDTNNYIIFCDKTYSSVISFYQNYGGYNLVKTVDLRSYSTYTLYGLVCYSGILYIGVHNSAQILYQYTISSGQLDTNLPIWASTNYIPTGTASTMINLYAFNTLIYLLRSRDLIYCDLRSAINGCKKLIYFGDSKPDSYYLSVAVNSTYICLSSSTGIDVYDTTTTYDFLFTISLTNCIGLCILGDYLYASVSNNYKIYQYYIETFSSTSTPLTYAWSDQNTTYPYYNCYGCYGMVVTDAGEDTQHLMWIGQNDSSNINKRAVFSISAQPADPLTTSTYTLGNSSLIIGWTEPSTFAFGGGSFVSYVVTCNNTNINNIITSQTITNQSTVSTSFSNLNMMNNSFTYTISVNNSFYQSNTQILTRQISNTGGCGYYSNFNGSVPRNLLTNLLSVTTGTTGSGYIYIGPLLINYSVGLNIYAERTIVPFPQQFQTLYGLVLQEVTNSPGTGYVTTNTAGVTGFSVISNYPQITGFYWLAWGI